MIPVKKARRHPVLWGDAEVRYLVREVDARDYACDAFHPHPMLHKRAVLRRIRRGLAEKFGVELSTTQIRKKLADLHYRSSERIARIRAQRHCGPPSPAAPPSPADTATTPSSSATSPATTPSSTATPSPAATPPPHVGSSTSSPIMGISPASLRDIGAGSPSAGGATGSKWVVNSPSEETDAPQNQIPTFQDLLASHRRMMAAVHQHGVMLERYVAAQQQGGSQ